jgi:ubiquinone/menaquinone biosynthesis C-methylase UbiE
MSLELRQAIREYEVERVIPLIPKGSRILEIGAGAGWQAKRLAEEGFDTTAIDIENSSLAQHSVCDILLYDGDTLPYPDHFFDVVFSSNVLDHIPHVREFQQEIQRVLKPTGIAIHVLPTTSWRLWTIASHYPHYLKQLVFLIISRMLPESTMKEKMRVELRTNKLRDHIRGFVTTILFVPRLGERGNHLTELYLFSRAYRRRFFTATGWKIQSCHPTTLFYSGYKLFGSALSLETRGKLSFLLGSSGVIYVLAKNSVAEF